MLVSSLIKDDVLWLVEPRKMGVSARMGIAFGKQRTMENLAIFSWDNSRHFDWAMFNSYVKLPEDRVVVLLLDDLSNTNNGFLLHRDITRNAEVHNVLISLGDRRIDPWPGGTSLDRPLYDAPTS